MPKVHYRVIKAFPPATPSRFGKLVGSVNALCRRAREEEGCALQYLAADVAFKDAGIASAHKGGRRSVARRRLGGLFRGLLGRLLGSRRGGGL